MMLRDWRRLFRRPPEPDVAVIAAQDQARASIADAQRRSDRAREMEQRHLEHARHNHFGPRVQAALRRSL